MKYLVTVGADPELFLRDKVSGDFHSAHKYVPGTKREPVKVLGGAIQVDGVAAEFNIDPASNPEEWMNNIQSVVGFLNRLIINQPGGENFTLTAAPTAVFDEKYFALLPDTVKDMGCDPDYNAWDEGKPNVKPKSNLPMRTGGGHVHIGWTEHADLTNIAHFYDCLAMTKQLDIALYLPSLLFDTDRKRQELYGKPGAFRPKMYGSEYRTLSNFWLTDPQLTRWVYDTTVEAAAMLLTGNATDKLWELPEFRGIIGKHTPTHKELLNIHDELVSFGFPALPKEYLYA